MGCDIVAVDWSIDLSVAREILGPDISISGNIDLTVLFRSREQIKTALWECIDKAGWGAGSICWIW